MRYLLFVFFFTSIIFSQSVFQSGKFKKQNSDQWRIINTGLDFTPIDICFPDSVHGWVIGNFEIANTNDGGETWTKQNLPVDTINFHRVFFINDQVGYIVGSKGLILATKNGGNSWVKQAHNNNKYFRLSDVSFINENYGWVVGSVDSGSLRMGGVVLNTTDGGETWSTQTDLFTGIIHYGIKFFNENDGIMFGTYGGGDNFNDTYIFKTNNGGITWDSTNNIGTLVSRFSIINQDTIWGCGLGFAISNDGGITWNTNFNLADSSLYPFTIGDILNIDNNKGWIVFSTIINVNNIVLHLAYTLDGGKSWIIENLPDNFEPYHLEKIGTYIYITGDSGKAVTNKPNPTNIFEQNKILPQKIKLNQNYPNPFNPSTTITYEIKETSFIELRIYDVLGRFIKLVDEGIKIPGKYMVKFEAENLSTGIYFYQLISGKYQTQNKMLLLK